MKGYPKRKEHKKPFGSPAFHNKTQNRFLKKMHPKWEIYINSTLPRLRGYCGRGSHRM